MNDGIKGLHFFVLGLAVAVLAATGIVAMTAYAADECDQTLTPGDDRRCTVGRNTFYVYAPPSYDPSQPTALIVDAHGIKETAEEQAGLDSEFCTGRLCWPGKGSGWRLEADTPGGGFIVLTPQGSNSIWNRNEENFILEAVAHVKTIANIDPERVYISGISNGAALTYWVGCPNTDVFSGMAPVSGGGQCESIDRALPVIIFDAEADFFYDNSIKSAENMAALNNCSRGPIEWLTIDKSVDEAICRDDPYATDPKLVPCSAIRPAIEPTVCKRWDKCDRGVEVVFCEVTPGDLHGERNESTDAHVLYGNASHLNLPSLAWRFFKRMTDGGTDGRAEETGFTRGCDKEQ